jgi:cobalt-zinc-cadmium efflux system membrane fusion protein
MKFPAHNRKRIAVVLVLALAAVIAAGLYGSRRCHGQAANATAPQETKPTTTPTETALDLSPSQLNAIRIQPVGSYLFPVEMDAVGSIGYDEDLSVQVFPDYQRTIIETLGQLGADVQKDQPLYTIKSPDLIQAESTLVAAAGGDESSCSNLSSPFA